MPRLAITLQLDDRTVDFYHGDLELGEIAGVFTTILKLLAANTTASWTIHVDHLRDTS